MLSTAFAVHVQFVTARSRLLLIMGSTFSRSQPDIESAQPPNTKNNLPPLYCNIECLPEGLTREPAETDYWYANFFDTAVAAPHEDGHSVIIFRLLTDYEILEDRLTPDQISLTHVYDFLFGLLGSNARIPPNNAPSHPRIVRRLQDIPYGIRVERLNPGPLRNLTLPKIEESPLILILFHRWALQLLSVVSYLHRHGIHILSLSATHVWLREDYSITLTGFIDATLPPSALVNQDFTSDHLRTLDRVWEVAENEAGEERAYLRDQDPGFDELFNPQKVGFSLPYSSVKRDLFAWATLVFRLMTNDFSKEPNGVEPIIDSANTTRHAGQEKRDSEASPERSLGIQHIIAGNNEPTRMRNASELRDIGPDQLGAILIKAWTAQYQNADEIKIDLYDAIRSANLGVNLEGEDEIVLADGRRWQDVLRVVDHGKVQTASRLFTRWAREVVLVGSADTEIGSTDTEK